MFVYILIYFIPYLATVDNFVTSLAFLHIYYLCYASFSPYLFQ